MPSLKYFCNLITVLMKYKPLLISKVFEQRLLFLEKYCHLGIFEQKKAHFTWQ